MEELDALAVPGFDLPAEALVQIPQEDSQAKPLASLAGLGLDGLGPAQPPASMQEPMSPTLAAAGLEGLVFDPHAPGVPAGARMRCLPHQQLHSRLRKMRKLRQASVSQGRRPGA